MKQGWSQRTLGELTVNFDSQRVPVKELERKAGPYPYYGASGVVDHVHDYLFDGEYLLIAEDGENLRSRTTPIAFMARGKFWVNNHAHIVRGNDSADTRFLAYAIQNADISGYLTGSTIPKLSQGSLNRIGLSVPPLEEQREIASVLGALDDKIELNRRMNATLEAMAQAVFKEWFIDGAKEEWETMKVEDALTITKGVSYRSNELAESEVALVTLKSVNRGGGYRTDGLKPYIGKFKPQQIIRPGELVVAQTDVTQGAEVIGKPAIVIADEVQKTLVASLDLMILRPKLDYLDQFFFYLLFKTVDFQNHIYGYTSGTTVLHLSKQGLPCYEFPSPPRVVGERFAAVVKPLFERIALNIAESRTLAGLRDTLLPKLMRGEVRVKEFQSTGA